MATNGSTRASETEDAHLNGSADLSLPTPENTPYRSSSKASRNSHQSNSSTIQPETNPPLPPEKSAKRSSRDIGADEKFNVLDPRRFTPTLHANLVSEILALRRDQEEKLRLIDSLEENLQSAHEERDLLKKDHVSTTKESRSLKRQLALLEGGTTSAIGELARERDEAVDSSADNKQRLEEALKKLRLQHNDSQRVHDQLAQERDAWEGEKRQFERKMHVAESRLKSVLNEVAAFQAAHANGPDRQPIARDSDGEESIRDADAGSIRSVGRSNSLRFSGSVLVNGQTLADELGFDDDDDDELETDDQESIHSPKISSNHARNFSRESGVVRLRQSNQSLESLRRPAGDTGRVPLASTEAPESGDAALESAQSKSYTDTGIQFSPPPSPTLQRNDETKGSELMRSVAPTTGIDSPSRLDSEFEANQGRKRKQLNTPVVSEQQSGNPMVSTGAQTTNEPLSPPKSPVTQSQFLQEDELAKLPDLISSGTQTVEPYPTLSSVPIPISSAALPLSVPSINIQPPTSRPSTPREPRLPQLTKDFGCQTNITLPTKSFSTAEAAVQTEGIQVDKRIAMLPRHLQPSAITSRPTSPNSVNDGNRVSRGSADYFDTNDAYPGNNDDGPLSDQRGVPARRPHRLSSLFAGFESASSGEDFDGGDLSDGDYCTPLSARPRSGNSPRTNAKRSAPSHQTALQDPNQNSKTLARSSMKSSGTEVYSSFRLGDKETTVLKRDSFGRHERSPAAPSGPGDRASVMRKAAMIQRGIATHQGRTRSPSLPDSHDPPFPIPTRASSRQPSIRIAASLGRRSPTKGLKGHRDSYRSHSIRKVRSAAALPPLGYRRQDSRSPPMSPSTEAPESPGLPPLPKNDLTTPRNKEQGNANYKRHKHELSTNTDKTHNTDPASVSSTSQMTSVVDSIAQTMVGEWMFKYVRRRKSFGVPDNSASDSNGNDRHKRWVWLAPYERAILWSSKQPASGNALMGKTGRKLSIQSVLDVKDDNPVPKGAGSIFNRSILILTPQRALKFTAQTADRHYIWLTALSFLAHSQQEVPELPNPLELQPKKEPVLEFEAAATKPKRGGIRDSIRLAKGKPVVKQDATSVPSIPSLPSARSSHIGDGSNFHVPDSFGIPSTNHARDDSRDAAEPPYIPRFDNRAQMAAIAHGRKRSNTGGHIRPPLSFRGFSGLVGSGHQASSSTAGASDVTGSSEMFASQGSVSNTPWGTSQTASRRTSNASSTPANFFDAIGTMRMEAFISPLGPVQFKGQDGTDDLRHTARRRSREVRRKNSKSRHISREDQRHMYSRGGDSSLASVKTSSEAEYFREDPFRNF